MNALDMVTAIVRNAAWLDADPVGNVVVLSERPAVVQRDTYGRIHADEGPALVFRDGSTSYYWYGGEVPADLFLHPEPLTVDDIDSLTGAEQALAIHRYGVDRYEEESWAYNYRGAWTE